MQADCILIASLIRYLKLRLGTFRAANQMLHVALTARLEADGGGGESPQPSRHHHHGRRSAEVAASASDDVPPFFTVDIVDGADWIGSWVHLNLSSSAWQRYEVSVPLPFSRRGHFLDVAVVVGHQAGTYLIDDVNVTQTLAPPPPPAPPSVAWGATYDFERLPRVEGGAGAVRLITYTPEAAAGASADLCASSAGRAGGHGAMITVSRAPAQPWHTRIGLGLFEAQRAALVLKFSAKLASPAAGAQLTPPPPPPPFPPQPPPSGLAMPCTNAHGPTDSKVEKCMGWCTEGAASQRSQRCAYCKCRQCPACLAAAATGPFLTVSVTDADNASEWLGYWQRLNLSSAEWRQFKVTVPLSAAKRGHTLETSIVLGHAAGVYLIDDVSIYQTDPVALALQVGFEEPDAAVVAVGTGGSVAVPVAGGGLMTANLASEAAAHGGGKGAEVVIRELFTPAWQGRLELGTIVATLNALTIRLWGRASRLAPIHANLIDSAAAYEWLAFWEPLNLTNHWAEHSTVAPLDPTRRGHRLQMSLVMGATAATYSLDDISLTQSCENWPTPWLPPAPLGSLYTGFEDCTGAIPRMDSATSSGGARDSATSGVGSSGGSPIAAELYAPMAARTGQLGMRLKVRRHLRIDEERPKLILGSLILADASRASDAILLSLWAKMQVCMQTPWNASERHSVSLSALGSVPLVVGATVVQCHREPRVP